MDDKIDWPGAIAAAVDRAKEEIRAEAANGRIPRDVPSFAALHDYVDANEYGGLYDTIPWITPMGQADLADGGAAAVAQVQHEIDAWIKAGGVRAKSPSQTSSRE